MTFLQIASKVNKEKKFFCHLSESGFQTILKTNFIAFVNIPKMPVKNMLKMFLFIPFYGTVGDKEKDDITDFRTCTKKLRYLI